MPFETDPTAKKDAGPQGHGLHLTGTAYATLCGHGYRDPGVSHLEPIQRLWERHMGLGSRTRSFNKAMEIGKKMERVAFEDCAENLRKGMLHESPDYEYTRVYEVYRGLYISQRMGEELLPDAANVDAPLVDVSEKYKDPKSGLQISGVTYASRRAQEAAMIARRIEDNQILIADGEEPLPVPTPKYDIPVKYAGAIDIKVTQSKRNADEVRIMGMPSAWPIQTAHYNRILREENERNGFDNSNYRNLSGIFHYCTETMEGYYYDLPHDPDLEREMSRRGELFKYCVENNIPPSSSEMSHEFYIYNVKGIEPEAVVPDPDMEEVFSGLINKRDDIDGAIEELNRSRDNINKSLERGILKMNAKDGGTVPKGVIVDTKSDNGKGIRYIHMKDKARRTTVINEAAINSSLMAAVRSKEIHEKMVSLLGQPCNDTTRLRDLEKLIVELGQSTQLVPEGEAGVLDLGHFTSKQLKDSEKGRQLSITSNKEIRMIYQRARQLEDGSEVGVTERAEGMKVSRNDQGAATLPAEVGLSTSENTAMHNQQNVVTKTSSTEHQKTSKIDEEGETLADRMEVPEAGDFPSF